MTDGMPSIIDNIVPKVVAKDIEINPSTTEWMIDPIQSYTMQLKRQKLPIFAEALNRNLTGLYFQFLQYKVKLNENVSIECKGVTRCLSEDTSIKVFRNGKIIDVQLKNLKKPFDVISYNFSLERKEVNHARIWDSGEKDIFEITTLTGRKVRASAEHKLFISNKNNIILKRTDALLNGDKLVIIE